MSKTELMPFAIVSHIHEIQAGTTPLLIELKLNAAPLEIIQQVSIVYTRLTDILNKTLNGNSKLKDQVREENFEKLFTELQSEAKELYKVLGFLTEIEDVNQGGNIRNLVERLEETLQNSRLLL